MFFPWLCWTIVVFLFMFHTIIAYRFFEPILERLGIDNQYKYWGYVGLALIIWGLGWIGIRYLLPLL